MLDDPCRIIKAVIEQYYAMYCSFSKEYYEKCHVKQYNFKKLSVKKALEDTDFLLIVVPDYLGSLNNNRQLKRSLLLFQYNDYNCRYRFKYIGTVTAKLRHYNVKNDHNGDVYISKTINDLCGLRLIVPRVRENFNEVIALLDDYKHSKVIKRYYTRRDGRYFGIHCYFQTDNRYFPWELQIWDTLDASNNYYEHGRHEDEREGG
ncbi:MAG: hypothetical protein DUD34_12515 [Lactobacillus sp.]|jgi:hypothetical protein|nr:MAG: hypothetical protein DUD34_12515 [Lactobacillus sp.]